MKTFCKMSIAFLYDDETGIIVNEPILEASNKDIPIEVLQRAYVSLGYNLHTMAIEKRYKDEDYNNIKERHNELLKILEDKR